MIDFEKVTHLDELWYVKPMDLVPRRVLFGEKVRNRGGGGWISVFEGVGVDLVKKKSVVVNTRLFNSSIEAEVFSVVDLFKFFKSLKNDEVKSFGLAVETTFESLSRFEETHPDLVLRFLSQE